MDIIAPYKAVQAERQIVDPNVADFCAIIRTAAKIPQCAAICAQWSGMDGQPVREMRDQIRVEVASICPLDPVEAATQHDVIAWIDSGAELCRLQKPADPPKHLVSYFAVVDGEHVLLVDHVNAGLWLPTGGHVEPGEHPRATAVREAREELSIEAEFLFEGPLLLTSTTTVGATAGHTDVSLWYVLRGNRRGSIEFDQKEFRAVHWFHKDETPMQRTDREMARFLAKLYPFHAQRVHAQRGAPA